MRTSRRWMMLSALAVTAVGSLTVAGLPGPMMCDDPTADEANDASEVSVDKVIDTMAAGVSTSPPSDWIPGVGNIPAILINPPGGPPIIVPTAPRAPYTPWSPWKFPGSWIPTVPPPAGPFPTGRVPGIIKWNPTKKQWEFWPIPSPAGMLPIPLPQASVVTGTPVGGDTPVNEIPGGAVGEDSP